MESSSRTDWNCYVDSLQTNIAFKSESPKPGCRHLFRKEDYVIWYQDAQKEKKANPEGSAFSPI